MSDVITTAGADGGGVAIQWWILGGQSQLYK
jgi:hypothetical protein